MKKLFIIPCCALIAFSFFAFHGEDCPAEGKPNPKKGKKAELKPREKSLNRHKNRETIPQGSDFDNTVTTEKMYGSKDDSIFSENKAANLVGYFFRATDAGMESCNCYTEDKSKRSINIYISPTPIAKETRTADCIVTVLTPYSVTLNSDWTADKLNDKLAGKKIKVSGWLIYDFTRSGVSIETNSNSAEPERRTIWGLCPVTAITTLAD
jgi:hypothetical protein